MMVHVRTVATELDCSDFGGEVASLSSRVARCKASRTRGYTFQPQHERQREHGIQHVHENEMRHGHDL